MELYYHDLDRNVLVLRADGGLNSETADQMLAQLEELIDAGLGRIIVDCSHLDFVSILGLGKLVRIHKRLGDHGGDVRLAAVRGALVRVLEIARMNKIFALYPDIEQARLSFRPAAVKPSLEAVG